MFLKFDGFGSVADWVSGIGTFVAVIVSLYLANHKKRPKLIFKPLFNDKNECELEVYNPGYEPVMLNFIGDTNGGNLRYLESYSHFEPYSRVSIKFKFKNEKGTAKIKITELVTGYRYYLTIYLEENKVSIFESYIKFIKGRRVYKSRK